MMKHLSTQHPHTFNIANGPTKRKENCSNTENESTAEIKKLCPNKDQVSFKNYFYVRL